MKKKLVVTMVALFVLALSFAMAPKKANAIPSFAQKYHFSCAVCHTVFPNLNPFGRAFWRNGFRLPGTNGTPADATQITEGLSLPNPWPIPVMVEPTISYQHYTNENVSNSTDGFSAGIDLVYAGAFKLYTPLADSLSFYVHFGDSPLRQKQVVASINGIGSGLGLTPHLLNLKLGQVGTASPYIDRQEQFYVNAGPTAGNIQNLSVGYDGEAAGLIHSRQAGFALYGTPGYHLWYKVTVTNDTTGSSTALQNSGDNGMAYSYQLKEYAPIPMGQLEFGYYGATVAEPLSAAGQGAWTNRITVNGVDVDLANDVYELGLAYMVQNDALPYGNTSVAATNITDLNGNVVGNTHSSNGYSTFEAYGRYLFPTLLGKGVMFSADYGVYSWTHSDLANATIGQSTATCSNNQLYGNAYPNTAICNEGIKDALDLQAQINLAYNAHLYVGYVFTNISEANTFGTGLDFAF